MTAHTREAIAANVISKLAEHLCVAPETVVPSASLVDDLGADSLDTIEIAMLFEDEYDIEVPDEDIESITTVSTIIEYIIKRLHVEA